ncbi:type II secretion system GspH family protein [Myxococcota bacterium]|nr:type II secretion system GspH family protein [Myxococcota bacterium]
MGPYSERRSDARRVVGFTLVEAVVLIALLGILGGVAAPRFLSLRELEGARAHRQALADLRHAQRQAAGSGCPVQVDFDAGGYRLQKRSGCRAGNFDLELVDPVVQRTPYAVILPEGVTLTSSVDPIVLDALGRITRSDGTTASVSIQIGGLALEGVGETGLFRVP